MTLSEKKKTQIYDAVHEEIMQARLRIWAMRFEPTISVHHIDDILSDLCINAPQKAIDVLTNQTAPSVSVE